MGVPNPHDETNPLDDLLQAPGELGVQLTIDRLRTLAKLFQEWSNRTHLWCNRGWTPEELIRHFR